MSLIEHCTSLQDCALALLRSKELDAQNMFDKDWRLKQKQHAAQSNLMLQTSMRARVMNITMQVSYRRIEECARTGPRPEAFLYEDIAGAPMPPPLPPQGAALIIENMRVQALPPPPPPPSPQQLEALRQAQAAREAQAADDHAALQKERAAKALAEKKKEADAQDTERQRAAEAREAEQKRAAADVQQRALAAEQAQASAQAQAAADQQKAAESQQRFAAARIQEDIDRQRAAAEAERARMAQAPTAQPGGLGHADGQLGPVAGAPFLPPPWWPKPLVMPVDTVTLMFQNIQVMMTRVLDQNNRILAAIEERDRFVQFIVDFKFAAEASTSRAAAPAADAVAGVAATRTAAGIEGTHTPDGARGALAVPRGRPRSLGPGRRSRSRSRSYSGDRRFH
jgi:chemotaxis protein histidine kinase CheA